MAIYYADGSNSANGRLIKFSQNVLTSAATYNPGNDPSNDFTSVISLSVTPTASTTYHYIHWSICFSISSGTTMGTRLYAGSSAFPLGDSSGSRPRVTTAQSVHQGEWWNIDTGMYRYDHNTSSQITYSLRTNTHDGRAFAVNRSWSDSNSNYMDNCRSCSFLNVMEFSG